MLILEKPIQERTDELSLVYPIYANKARGFVVVLAAILMWGCAASEMQSAPHAPAAQSESSHGTASTTTSDLQEVTSNERHAEAFEVVDCLLPGQVRRLGVQMIYMTPRRPVRATAEDCVIRGGEYVSYDRADYGTSLEIWKKAADLGNVEAQYYVATLYERGVTGTSDYVAAVQWYEKAAEQGHRQAAMNLGRLYDQGLGVEQNSQLAFSWMTKASGLEQTELTNLLNRSATRELQTLQKTVKVKDREIHALQSSLSQTRGEKIKLQNLLAKEQAKAEAERTHLAQLEQHYQLLKTRLQAANAQGAEREKAIQHSQQQLQSLEKQLAQKNLEGEQLKSLKSKYQTLQQQLTHLQREKDQERTLREQQESDYQQVQRELEQSRKQVVHQEEEMLELTKKIEDITSSKLVANLPPGKDLGLEGPKIQIIDPPMVGVRGIRVEAPRRDVYLSQDHSRSITGRVLAPAGLWEVRVNGLVADVDQKGEFSYDLPVVRSKEQAVPVDILAVDIQNKRSVSSLNVLWGMPDPTQAALSQATQKPFGQYHALVIGNDHYQHWEPLQNAIADAEAVGKVLHDQYGFQVKVLKDASRKDILKTLNDYRKLLTEQDNLLIYYAGHGYLEPNIDRGYWIPVEAELQDNSDWILLPTITDLLQLMTAKHILVVADSCFAGKLTRSSLAQLRPGLSDEARMDLLQTLAEKRVRTALTSGGVRPVLDEGGGGHSIFTEALLGVLKNNVEILETERVYLAVRNRVMKSAQMLNAEQIPTYSPIHLAGHESLGDFIFVPQNSKVSS